jgi:sulfonate transport system substrate-binding protein
VLKVYEKARVWIAAHPDETAKIVAEESKLSLPVAKLQLSRNDFSHPQLGAQQLAALKAAAPILVQEQLVKPGTDLNQVIDALIDVKSAQPVFAANGQ